MAGAGRGGAPFFDVRMRGFPARAEVADVLCLIDDWFRTFGEEEVALAEPRIGFSPAM
jgi:hypothetical protein